MPTLTLTQGLSFADLYSRPGLEKLDGLFLDHVANVETALYDRLLAARAEPAALSALESSELILDLAPSLERFLATLFEIETEVQALTDRHTSQAVVFDVKRNFVQRTAIKRTKAEELEGLDGEALAADLELAFGEALSELSFARHIARWEEALANAKAAEDEAGAAAATARLDLARRYAAWAALTEEGRNKHGADVLFKQPAKLDPEHLVHDLLSFAEQGAPRHHLPPQRLRAREGFALTDQGCDLTGALDQANYCIWCHKQGKDSCSTGLREKAPKDAVRPPPFRKNDFGITQAGCPLEEKISEFQKLKSDGLALAALAVIAVDNPMAAATGHRICNDCMKSCIYQKQEPVNIPQVETRTLKDVLDLPWGFEIYSLLTRWNPLDFGRPLPRPDSGRKVLVVGLGPAGFTLAHHLLNDGHCVVAVDGLKIEPLPSEISGVQANGERVAFEPVHNCQDLFESLDDRVLAGFGGVAEYGITVRWDKNFLKLIRLLLERRAAFALFGGVRLGGTVTLEQAWELGFDHIALAMGAGRPTILDLPNGLARGVRTASDFLMALQLTGAAKQDSIANMQIRLPIVVIGGGLTAIDTATESLAYYPRQVEKFLARFEALAGKLGEEKVRQSWTVEEAAIAEEFLVHARVLRAERAAAATEGRAPRIIDLLQSWGGSTIAYRKRMIDSPSYTLNHEEVEKALEEGITFAECLNPLEIQVDDFGHAKALKVAVMSLDDDGRWQAGAEQTLPARSVFIAAGTTPNTVLAQESKGQIEVEGRYFQACDVDGKPVTPDYALSKPDEVHVLLAKQPAGHFLSFFGDLHPSYFGNVVKAMGSAKQGYPVITRALGTVKPASPESSAAFIEKIDDLLRPRVEWVERLTPTIIEVVVRAPLAARNFHPGQFYRLQNYEAYALKVADTCLAMEGLALTGAWVNEAKGLISVIVLEMGGSSNLCQYLKPGEPLVLMGPTGAPTEIPSNETVLLAGGGLGNAVLFSIGQAMRAVGSRVLYFAGYKQPIDRYKLEEIERAADLVVWCCDTGPAFEPGRPQDKTFQGNIVEAMTAYGAGQLGDAPIALGDVDRIIAIGSDRMMAAVAAARHGILMPYLKETHFAIGSINSPMQCMMKQICAQCLQIHIDPVTGEKTHVFSCYEQDQELDRVDWQGLRDRLHQNALVEKLTAQWVAHCLDLVGPPGAGLEAAE